MKNVIVQGIGANKGRDAIRPGTFGPDFQAPIGV